MSEIDAAFRRARIHAVRQMSACEQAELRWSETSITEIVMAYAAQAATVVPFTQNAEARSGADWVWWWIDGDEAYGMLVQAKRVTVSDSQWMFDFGYKVSGTGRTQHEVLHDAARLLDLLPTYALYLGTGDYRSWQRCSSVHRSGRCLACVKRSISLMPALLADGALVRDSVSTYERSVALEDLTSSAISAAPLIPALKRQLGPELSEFLTYRQDGTRAVARGMIDRVLQARLGQASTLDTSDSARTGEHDRLGSVFSEFPNDTGHWNQSYFRLMLAPLLRTPPWYALQVMTGNVDPRGIESEMPENIAGVIVVNLSKP
ncbi:hypothetical protein CEY15_04705 [Dietzia natronolimnaea]|uniref:Uncharacterized protein n=1 Tax=Dietzia natronolimnaea TaxID=161920 RepID=A0A2A2WSY2_9ACTN|nr:DUF6615 family protein [Dietzia natronolimnaea]PAY24288.1 hypothetical protein CEY15_04705 [Dietzia natronolimnaea]